MKVHILIETTQPTLEKFQIPCQYHIEATFKI